MEHGDKPAAHSPRRAALRRDLAGRLHEPGDPAHAELSSPWNVAVATHPAAVVAAGPANDVIEAVDFAGANGMAVAVQATGHDAGSAL